MPNGWSLEPGEKDPTMKIIAGVVAVGAIALGVVFATRGDDNIRAATELNHAFHDHIYRASGSQVLIPMIESLWLQSGPYVHAAAFLHEKERLTLIVGDADRFGAWPQNWAPPSQFVPQH